MSTPGFHMYNIHTSFTHTHMNMCIHTSTLYTHIYAQKIRSWNYKVVPGGRSLSELNSLFIYFYVMCMSICLHVCMCTIYMSGAQGGHRKVSEPLL